MIVAERELDLSRLDPSGRTWANDHLAYTHGYGLVAVPAGGVGVDEQGKPTFVTSEFGPGGRPPQLREPRVYYGVQPPARAAVGDREGRAATEVEKPLPGDTPAPRLPLRRTAASALGVAVRPSALRVALRRPQPAAVGDARRRNPRILLHRDVGERLRHLAPFLHWERRPAVTVVDGRIQFLAHGYTTSDSYPVLGACRGSAERRSTTCGASVVATVDAFSGRVTHVPDGRPSDPIMRAWRAAFPTLFTPSSGDAGGRCARHLRYPRELFDVQSKIWATYHIDNIDDFYYEGRRVEASGRRLRARSRSSARCAGPRWRAADPTLRPGFVLARLPGTRRQQFMLTTMFTPYSEENLSGYLAGHGRSSGRPSLTQLSLPRSRRVLGPSQVTPADPRQPRSERQAAAAQPGDDRPRRPGGQHRRAQPAAGRADRRLVPVRPDDLRHRAGNRRHAAAPRGRVPQRPRRIRATLDEALERAEHLR